LQIALLLLGKLGGAGPEQLEDEDEDDKQAELHVGAILPVQVRLPSQHMCRGGLLVTQASPVEAGKNNASQKQISPRFAGTVRRPNVGGFRPNAAAVKPEPDCFRY
jgi:hypothetical protein